jgi:hypothetical protein
MEPLRVNVDGVAPRLWGLKVKVKVQLELPAMDVPQLSVSV